MIKVIAKNFVKENKSEKVIELAKALVEETLKEDGCINYGMYQDANNPSILIMVEEWKTMEDLNKHMCSQHFKRIVPQMGEYICEKVQMNICKKVL